MKKTISLFLIFLMFFSITLIPMGKCDEDENRMDSEDIAFATIMNDLSITGRKDQNYPSSEYINEEDCNLGELTLETSTLLDYTNGDYYRTYKYQLEIRQMFYLTIDVANFINNPHKFVAVDEFSENYYHILRFGSIVQYKEYVVDGMDMHTEDISLGLLTQWVFETSFKSGNAPVSFGDFTATKSLLLKTFQATVDDAELDINLGERSEMLFTIEFDFTIAVNFVEALADNQEDPITDENDENIGENCNPIELIEPDDEEDDPEEESENDKTVTINLFPIILAVVIGGIGVIMIRKRKTKKRKKQK